MCRIISASWYFAVLFSKFSFTSILHITSFLNTSVPYFSRALNVSKSSVMTTARIQCTFSKLLNCFFKGTMISARMYRSRLLLDDMMVRWRDNLATKTLPQIHCFRIVFYEFSDVYSDDVAKRYNLPHYKYYVFNINKLTRSPEASHLSLKRNIGQNFDISFRPDTFSSVRVNNC